MVNGTECRPDGVDEDDIEQRVSAMEEWVVRLEATADRLLSMVNQLVSPREHFADLALAGQKTGWVTRDEVSAWVDSQPSPWPDDDTVPRAGIAWLKALRAEREGA